MIHLCSTCGCKDAESFEASKPSDLAFWLMPGIANDIFDTKEEAMERAKELGVNEIHQHKIINNSGNEDIIFMPYKSHQEYERKEGAKRNLGDNSPFNVEDFGAEVDCKVLLDHIGKLAFEEVDDAQRANDILLAISETTIKERPVEIESNPGLDAESFDAEVCPCGCAMRGCVCSSSCKGECLNAESFEGDSKCDRLWDCKTCERCKSHCGCGNDKKLRRTNMRKMYGKNISTPDARCGFDAETCPMCKNDNPIIGGEVCAECTQYLEDEQDRFSQRYDAESYDDESPMMKNITVIGAFALAIIIGKKLKR